MTESLDPTLYLLVIAIVFVSSFVHALSGFGFSIFTMSLLPLFLPMVPAAAIVNVAFLGIPLVMITRLKSHVDVRFVAPITVFVLLGNTAGFYFLMTLDGVLLKSLLGLGLFLFGLGLLLFNHRISLRKTIVSDIVAGILAGVFGGLFNISGIILVVYFLAVTDDKYDYVIALQLVFLVSVGYVLLLNLAVGNFADLNIISISLSSVLTVVVGTLAGMRVLKRLNKATIGRFAYSFMMVMGVVMVLIQLLE